MPFSHIGINVPPHKFEEMVAFYLAALAPLGYKEHMRPVENVVGLGVHYPDFWITGCPRATEDEGTERHRVYVPVHIAFDVNNRELVHAFHSAALKVGGQCNGEPSPRPQYTKLYYASFILDPIGNNVEVVCMWDPSAPES